MRIGAILYFRMNSKRLPGKPLLKIQDKTLLEIIYERVLKVKGLCDLIIATSSKKSDDPINILCKKKNYKIYRGNLNDVAKRTVKCIKKHNLDFFLRVCGDRPFFDYNLANKQIRLCKKKKL